MEGASLLYAVLASESFRRYILLLDSGGNLYFVRFFFSLNILFPCAIMSCTAFSVYLQGSCRQIMYPLSLRFLRCLPPAPPGDTWIILTDSVTGQCSQNVILSQLS